jgi:hypothetical protein
MKIKDLLEEARSENKLAFVKGYANINVDWNYLVEQIDIALSTKKKEELGDFGICLQENNLVVRDLFYMTVVSSYPTKSKEINAIANTLSKDIWDVEEYRMPQVSYFVNLVSKNTNVFNKTTVGPHTDPTDAIFLQLVGNATWNTYSKDNLKDPIASEVVYPGDIIIIPTGVYHEVDAVNPRAGIQFCFPEFIE